MKRLLRRPPSAVCRPFVVLCPLSSVLRILGFLVSCFLLSGCINGSATEAHLKFGVPGVFAVQHDSLADKSTERTVRLGDSKTHVQILLFDWESSGKDIVISKPKPDPK